MRRTTIPATVLTTVKKAAKTGDVVSITSKGYSFNGQVLKADVITFDSGGNLELTGLRFPFLAIAAKEIKFADPDERAYIKLPTDKVIPSDGSPHPGMPKAATGNHGNPTQNGGNGTAGKDGKKGYPPTDGMLVPTLYLFADKITVQPGGTIPNAIKLHIFCNGVDGGKGGNGQRGQDGGDGGNGGPSKWNGLWCEGGAGSGGNGGNGGLGGPGHPGGNGSNGGNVFYCGSADAIDTFHYSKVYNMPGYKGEGGINGKNGIGGNAGARGAHTGGCSGGTIGRPGSTIPWKEVKASPGRDGQQGVIYHAETDVLSLFSRSKKVKKKK